MGEQRELDFAWSWCVGNELERLGSFSAALLLKLIDPIGNRLNHFARCVASNFGLSGCLRCGIYLALFDNADVLLS